MNKQPDRLHPNAAEADALAPLIDRAIDKLVAEGKLVRDGDRLTLSPERHAELLARFGVAEQ